MSLTTAERLGREDWIRAGLDALAAGGIEAVRVEPLAKSLGVTKGSFYWHFGDRTALLRAVGEAWERRNTLDVIERIEADGGDAAARAWRLMEICIDIDGRPEMGVRAWAQADPWAADLVRRVDRRRLDYLEGLFRELGFSDAETKARSRLAYFALIGEFAMGVQAGREDRLAAARLNHAMLTRRD